MAMRKVLDRLISSSWRCKQLWMRDSGMLVRCCQSPPRYPNQSLKLRDTNFRYRSVAGRNVVEAMYPKKPQFVDVDKNVTWKHLGLEEMMFNSLHNDSSSSYSSVDSSDFLGANKLGKKFLIGNYGKETRVPVESLRGKIIGLYFLPSMDVDQVLVRCTYGRYYNYIKETGFDYFEMIFVALPTPMSTPRPEDDLSLFNYNISILPWLAVPFDDLDWRSYLYRLYCPSNKLKDPVFIDTRNNKFEVLPPLRAKQLISLDGPQSYPVRDERVQQLEAEVKQLGKETSIESILGSDSRDYLIDRHSNKVPISSLQDKDVLLYAYSKRTAKYEFLFVKQLEEIYNQFRNHGFEIVSLNLDHFGNEKLWKNHLTQIPWLALPLGERGVKNWLLRTMMINNRSPDSEDPVFFVKPKGESLLDPYGYQVFEKFGIQAFPFTRKAAAHSVWTSLKGLSFKSFVDKASHLGLDFNSLIRNKADGGMEHVSLSTILEERAGGILLLFASLETCSQEQLKSLINVYLSQNELSSPSFEVVFVSMDKDTQSFNDHFSVMPWFAFQRPLKRRECKKLAKITAHDDLFGYGHFLAFGPDQLLLQVGLLTKSFESCEFPFVNDAESTDHLSYCITASSEWWMEADGTRFNKGDGWWRGIEYKYIESSEDESDGFEFKSDRFEDEEEMKA